MKLQSIGQDLQDYQEKFGFDETILKSAIFGEMMIVKIASLRSQWLQK
jgi:hypothetical protein